MKDKWLKFKSSHSPVEVTVNQGASDIVADWQRLPWASTFMDGRPLLEIMNELKINQADLTADQLRDFFSNTILNKYTGNNKEDFLNTMMKSFHQGGLLHPASAGMYHVLKDEEFGPAARPEFNTKQVNIRTSEKGFIVQEIYTVKKCLPSFNATDEFHEEFSNGILPDPGKEYVFQAQTTVAVGFKTELQPTVVNNTITYGSEYVKNTADKRNWFEKLADFFKDLFNYKNAVINLAESDLPENHTFKP